MKLLVTQHIVQLLQRELDLAGRREIGGVLVGECLSADTFRLMDMSVQRTGGGATHFVREVEPHRTFLESFFDRTSRQFERFNYLGEWHSHPTVPALPSLTDITSMQSIVDDVAVGAGFAVLLITRKRFLGSLELSASAFRSGDAPRTIDLASCPTDGRVAAFRQVRRRKRHWI